MQVLEQLPAGRQSPTPEVLSRSAELQAAGPAGSRNPTHNDRRLGRLLERRLAFLVPLAASLPAAWVLVFRYHSIYNDALSRLANGYYVLYSRDPHLAAIGFVWNPLPSLVDIPLLLFKGVWAPLSRDAFAANLISCLFYALGCWQLYRYFEDLRLGRAFRWALWLAFAANPLIFYYGVNGMSESLFIFTLIVTTRYLSRWLEDGSTRSLIVSGVALGIAYIDRNEAIAPAAAAGLAVAVVSYLRTRGQQFERRRAVLTDLYLFLSPFAVSFAFWAITSWVIVGHPFEQFSSQYGNAAQIKAAGPKAFQPTMTGRFAYAAHAVETVAPLLIVILLIALIRMLAVRDWRPLAPIAVPLAVLAFEVVAYTNKQIFPWYRYYIYACPAAVMIAGCVAARSVIDLTDPGTLRLPGKLRVPRRLRKPGRVMIGTLCALMATTGGVTTALTLGRESGLSEQDRYQLAYVLWPSIAEARGAQLYPGYIGIRRLAEQLDSMHLPDGGLLVDNFTTCIPELILDSHHPTQFVIPNDEDYQQKFGVPYQFGVRYFLVPDPLSNPVDALNEHLPSLYANGQGLATLVGEIHVASCPTFRLYKALPIIG